MAITPKLLRAVGASKANADLYAPLLEKYRVVPGDAFNTITSRTGIAMIVSQGGYESGYFTRTVENLNYTVQALMNLYNGKGQRYFTDAQAREYGSIKDDRGVYVQRANERMIGNLYYGGRLGNRGVNTDDGFDFCGSGLIQNTGLANHQAFADSIGMQLREATKYSRTPEGAVRVLYWYWRSNGLIIPASRGDVAQCTRIIQGGQSGLLGRIELYKRAIAVL